ncbi:MAG: xanthine dehydrogenase family protein subunit M, partial [Acidobacteriota bacterium]|nr:xanthine dehydrogenase family protein subunit M [Acidobacteriota bacterium]
LVSVAALVDVGADNKIRSARIALDGVAHKPWRVPAAEASLQGREGSEPVFRDAAESVVRGAKPHRYNAFKVELARRAIVRALPAATERNQNG